MVNGITIAELSGRFPLLYHMAQLGSWRSVEEHGLLSTTALLDLFELRGNERFRIESCHRPDSIPITHPVHGSAVIRDQKPMSDTSVRKALTGGLKPTDWYRELNSRVFFWLTEKRLNTLLNARAYRSQRHDVLVVDTKRLVERHERKIVLCAINSGCTIPFPHNRGLDTFRRMADYPYASRKRNRDPIVELAVDYSVPDIRDFVIEVREAGAEQRAKVVWKR
jgi:Family of unknown function (DUF7002)